MVDAEGLAIPLSRLEFALVEALEAQAPGLTPTDVLGDRVWGASGWDPYMVHNLVRRVRRKLDNAGLVGLTIVVSGGGGYGFESAVRAVPLQSPPGRPRRSRWWLAAAAALVIGSAAAFGVFATTGQGESPVIWGAIAGTVTGEDGHAVAGVQVTACNEATPDPCPHSFTDSQGRFRLKMPPGVYVVSFSEPGQSIPTRSIPLSPGTYTEVSLEH